MVSLVDVRQAVADYMRSEGCSCCQDTEAHEAHATRLAQLLGVSPYSDGSGFDFRAHSSARVARGDKIRAKGFKTAGRRES